MFRKVFVAGLGLIALERLLRPARDPRTQPSEDPDHPIPELASFLVGPAERTLDFQLGGFDRSESISLQLLAGGSIVVGLASLADVGNVPVAVASLLVGAVVAYLALAGTVFIQLLSRNRRRAVPRGDKGLTETKGSSLTEAQSGWVEVQNKAFEANKERLEFKSRLVTIGIVALALETALVGAAVATAAFDRNDPSPAPVVQVAPGGAGQTSPAAPGVR